ncbi:MAG: DUF1735 domain-containing protein [Chitinophagaceae bacterium]|nr:DUF1735 domain-containing protein [Chitinophagaceae bacterium]
MKKLSIITATVVSGLFFFASCKKAVVYEPIGDGGQKIIKIQTYGGLASGFDAANLAFNPSSTSETLNLNLEYVAGSVSSEDIKVVVEVDVAAVAAYNATQTDPLKKYLVLPASAYTFPTQTVIIPANQTVSSTFKIIFNPSMIDGSKNFMIPITIKSITGAVAGTVKAPGTGTAYFHFIGNPLAGSYALTAGGRYNCTVTGDQGWAPQPGWVYPMALAIPANYNFAAIPSPKFIAPVTPTKTRVYVANLGAGTDRDYTLEVDPAVTVITNINVTLTPSFEGGISNIRWFQKTYDPVNKRFILLWTYNNQPGGVGNDRIIYEVLTKL